MSIFKRKHQEVKYKDNRFIRKERKLFSAYIEIEPKIENAKTGYTVRYFEDTVTKGWESCLYRQGSERIKLANDQMVYKGVIEIRAKDKETLHERINKVMANSSEEAEVSYNPNKQTFLSRTTQRFIKISSQKEANTPV